MLGATSCELYGFKDPLDLRVKSQMVGWYNCLVPARTGFDRAGPLSLTWDSISVA